MVNTTNLDNLPRVRKASSEEYSKNLSEHEFEGIKTEQEKDSELHKLKGVKGYIEIR